MQTSRRHGERVIFYSTKAKTLEDYKATAVLWLGWGGGGGRGRAKDPSEMVGSEIAESVLQTSGVPTLNCGSTGIQQAMKEEAARRGIEIGYLWKAGLASDFIPHEKEFSKALGSLGKAGPIDF